jgi:hypothetical protein
MFISSSKNQGKESITYETIIQLVTILDILIIHTFQTFLYQFLLQSFDCKHSLTSHNLHATLIDYSILKWPRRILIYIILISIHLHSNLLIYFI